MRTLGGAVTEEPWVLEGERPLQGILARPAAGTGARTPAVLLLTGGVLPRIGPHRFYVKLARRLARAGFPVLRFDFSGLSNPSDPVPESPSHEQRLRDGRTALEDLARREGFRSFVLVGMCRSAAPALSLALEHPLVTHGVFVNGIYLAGKELERAAGAARDRFRLRHYRGRARRAASWRRLLTGRSRCGNLARVLGRRLVDGLRRGAPVAPGRNPVWSRLHDRGLAALLVYAEGSSSFDVFETVHRPAIERIGPLPNLRVEVVAGADHTLTLVSSQERAMDLVERWLREKNPVATGPLKS